MRWIDRRAAASVEAVVSGALGRTLARDEELASRGRVDPRPLGKTSRRLASAASLLLIATRGTLVRAQSAVPGTKAALAAARWAPTFVSGPDEQAAAVPRRRR